MSVTATAKRRRKQAKKDKRYKARSAAASKRRHDRLMSKQTAISSRKAAGKRK